MVDTGLCKKTKIRFESIMAPLEPEMVASQIISAQRKGIEELSIPRHMFHMNRFFRLFPNKAVKHVVDFLEAYVESDK